MQLSFDAVYENGSFRPLTPEAVSLPEGQRVHLVLSNDGSIDPIELAAKVYEGLSPEEIDEIERIALDRSNFFAPRSVDP